MDMERLLSKLGEPTMGTAQMRSCIAALCIAAILTGCTDKSSGAVTNYDAAAAPQDTSSSTNTAQPLNTTEPVSAPQVQAPAHSYNFKEGDLYGYLGAVSEDDQKKGIGAPPVVTFRYAGFWDGEQHLETIDDNGTVIGFDECTVPCVAIKETMLDGSVRRLGYSTNSIIGLAFQDALSGQLRRSPAIGAIQEGYRFKGGDPHNAVNWQLIAKPLPPAPAWSPPASDFPATDNATSNSIG